MTNDPYNGVAAGVAMASPWWLPSLHTFSQVAAEVLPILGALWLVVQIAVKLVETVRKRKAIDSP